MDGKLGDDLPVQLDAGLVQSMHELAVADSFGTACGIDSDYPKLTKLRFALARWNRRRIPTLNRILGVTEEADLFPKYPLAFLRTFLRVYGLLVVACSWHDGFSFGL